MNGAVDAVTLGGGGHSRPLIGYAVRRLARALLTFAGLTVAAGLFVTRAGSGCALGVGSEPCPGLGTPTLAAWLAAALHLDFGVTSDHEPVAMAIATAAPATLLLVGLAAFLILLAGWGGAIVTVLVVRMGAHRIGAPGADPSSSTGAPGLLIGQTVSRMLTLLVTVCQGVPTFWVGGVLVAILSVGLGWLPPGGMVSSTLPAFGTAAYLHALQAQPLAVVMDVLAHLILPALTLALAHLITDYRFLSVALGATLQAPHMQVARAVGLTPRRLLWRAGRLTLPVGLTGSMANLPLLASALVLVEYLFGWPGLGLLAYQATRAGDAATLGALVVLFGAVVILSSVLCDVLAAWADPRLLERDT